MEINREQVFKDLEWKKLASSRMGSVTVSADQMASYYVLIKELTEEAEGWKEMAEGYQKQFEDCAEDRARLTEENERLKSVEFTCGFVKPHKVLECPIFDEISKAKADTVREFAEKVKERCIEGGIYPAFVANTIDQIAKEMCRCIDERSETDVNDNQ